MINFIIFNIKNTNFAFKRVFLFKNFDKFIGVKNIKDLFYNEDGSSNFTNLPDNYELYYRSISLFMIGDLIDGGNNYKYFATS